MHQPNKQLRAILVACVKPEKLQKVTESLISTVFEYNGDYFIIGADVSITGGNITLVVSPKNFDEVLELGKWYDREKFDGNPCNHILIEIDKNGCASGSYSIGNNGLWEDTVMFMYIKRP